MNRLGKSYPRASKFGPWFSPLDASWLDVALFKLSLRLCLRFARNGSHLQGFEDKNIRHLLHAIITSAPHYQVDSWELKLTTLEWFQSLFLSSDHLIYQTILLSCGYFLLICSFINLFIFMQNHAYCNWYVELKCHWDALISHRQWCKVDHTTWHARLSGVIQSTALDLNNTARKSCKNTSCSMSLYARIPSDSLIFVGMIFCHQELSNHYVTMQIREVTRHTLASKNQT